MRRKTILVDLDNVVYPWSWVMANLVGERKGVSPNALYETYKSWYIWDDWNMTKGEFDWIWEQGIRDGVLWGEGQPLPGAVDGLWRLSDQEWHIHIVTDRLNKFRLHDKAVMNTVQWLADNSIPYRSLSFTNDKSSIWAHAIVDDNPRNLVRHPAADKFLFPAPHNRKERLTEVYKLENPGAWNRIASVLGDGDETRNERLERQPHLPLVLG